MKSLVFVLILFSIETFAKDLVVASSSIQNKKTFKTKNVFNSFGCVGENLSPHLKWSNIPKETKYFAVTMFDPDAPTGSGWWHWILINIPNTINELNEGISSQNSLLPIGSIETRTDFGKPGYGGPCPPEKDKAHRYIIKVYALKDKIQVDSDASGALVGFYIHSLKISEGSITGKFGR